MKNLRLLNEINCSKCEHCKLIIITQNKGEDQQFDDIIYCSKVESKEDLELVNRYLPGEEIDDYFDRVKYKEFNKEWWTKALHLIVSDVNICDDYKEKV